MRRKLSQARTAAIETLGGLAVLYTVVCVCSALLFAFVEGKPFTDSIWWAFVTATTTGYGDISPVTAVGRVTGLILMHFGPGLAFPLATAIMASKLVKNHDAFTHDEQVAMEAKLDLILKELKK